MRFLLSLLPLQCLPGFLQYRHTVASPALRDLDQAESMLAFSADWDILGPFQIGTREASWGADPLEYHYGGFRNLQYDPNVTFRSSLPANGTVSWSKHHVDGGGIRNGSSSASVSLDLGFSNTDWDFLRTVYGWAATQYQAWARGSIVINSKQAQPVTLYTDGILEFWLDGVHHFGGDFYSYRRAPLVLHLEPGTHSLDIRLLRDVRADGGVGEPRIEVGLEIRASSGTLEFVDGTVLVSDIVRNSLAGFFGSVGVRNSGKTNVEVSAVYDPDGTLLVGMVDDPVVVRPGQSRPIVFQAAVNYVGSKTEFNLVVEYKNANDSHTITTSGKFKNLSDREPHKMTYMHPGGIVSYAIIRPPSKNAVSNGGDRDSFPVLLALHGAGVEAEDEMVAHALDPVPDLEAWAIFPTGVTPWSGDDWHSWGFADVEAAVAQIPAWIKATTWTGPGVDVNKWLVSGHSNGGQGTWFALTHRPDKVFAAAPVSGYLSIPAYVPYELWHPMEPALRSIVESSMNSYRHELLAVNAKGIPIQQQHGGRDKNVPPYHSRLMHQLLFEAGWNSSYAELPDSFHYFDGVMTTPPLRQFYKSQLSEPKERSGKLKKFSIAVASPGDMGAKEGIKVTQLEVPGRYGRMDVIVTQRDRDTCVYNINTTNILSFKISPRACNQPITIDNVRQELKVKMSEEQQYWKTAETWKLMDSESTALISRSGRQLGALDAILRTRGRFTVAHSGNATYDIALQISRNLYQYFYADSNIRSSFHGRVPEEGNVITVAIGTDVPGPANKNFPLRFDSSSTVSISDANGRVHTYTDEEGLAAIFLRSLDGERLELVVWGSFAEAASWAARLVPTLTGVGQPDFVVLSKSSLWEGVQGAVAIGFFNHAWKVAESSFLT